MNADLTIRELFKLPEQVRKGDFVHKLTEGVANAAETASTYVPTPALADAFDRALTLVGTSMRDGQCHAAYLHGSFGSGKSHFMAMLSLLLADNPVAWSKRELQGLRPKHERILGKTILELHFHMIDKRSIEEAVLGGYVEYVRRHHPDAPVPSVFADEELFENAEAMRAEIGDEKFFAKMGGGGDDGWGDLAQGAWDRARFDAARKTADREEREALFDALVRSWFQSFASTARTFVDFDRGLSVISCHARDLGYDAIVLFLDELILWMSQRVANAAFLHEQVGKMVKLVEYQVSPRPVPIVSFIARQRDLASMVGEKLVGTEEQALRDALKHWEGRFDTITLEDSNLPAIIEGRILEPAGPDAKERLDASFERIRRELGPAWDTHLGTGDARSFRQVFPFSPTLVEALVALSNSLQRERTAIKLLVELLVEHVGDYKVGQIVAIGDLYDVLVGGEEPADGVMRSRFRMAKQLYRDELLPIIQEQRGTNSPERCQRLRPDHKLSLGCAGCPETRCRADNRLAKTLLIAALVPEVRPLKDLTVRRLVELNHGSVKSSIPGAEGPAAAKLLRDWASKLGQLSVGDEQDPRIRLVLDDVSIQPILDSAKSNDTPGARKKVIFDLLFSALGVEERPTQDLEWKHEYRGIERRGHIRFGNVRQMSESALRVADGAHFKLVIDFPFDEPGFGPDHDLEVVRKVRESGGDYTLVWLPSFFGAELEREIGQVAILEAILGTRDERDRYLGDLAPDQRERTHNALDNLRQQKRNRLQLALAQAYGIARAEEGVLDSGRTVEEHLHFLREGEQWRRPPVSNFRDAIGNYLDSILEARFPHQPDFSGHKITRARADKLVERFGEVVDAENKRLAVDRDTQRELAGTLAPLGLLRVIEGSAIYDDRLVSRIQRALESEGLDRPTVGQVRDLLDPSRRMGLTPEIEELAVRCFARATARTFSRDGKTFLPSAKTPLIDDDLLERPDLPSVTDWTAARELAGLLFGIGGARSALHAENLQRFVEELEATVRPLAEAAARLPVQLQKWLDAFGIEESDRLVTAQSGAELVDLLQRANPRQKVEALARFEPKRSAAGLGTSLKRAKEVGEVLADEVVFGALRGFLDRVERGDEAREEGERVILEPLRTLLVRDEIQKPLAAELRNLAKQAQRIPASRPSTTAAPSKPARARKAVLTVEKQGLPAGEGLRVIEDALASAREKLASAAPEAVISFRIIIEEER